MVEALYRRPSGGQVGQHAAVVGASPGTKPPWSSGFTIALWRGKVYHFAGCKLHWYERILS